MTQRKISIRRLFHDYCEIVTWSHPVTCGVAGCDAPAAYSEYGTICLAGHIADEQGWMPISRTADLALSIVPAVRRDAGMTTDLREAQKRYATPDHATLPDLIRQVEARGWLWEAGHYHDERGSFYVRVWTPGPPADEHWGYGATVEEATQRAIAMLPVKAGE